MALLCAVAADFIVYELKIHFQIYFYYFYEARAAALAYEPGILLNLM